MREHVVYRAYDGADRLLYVGCTNDIDARMKSHHTSSPWAVYMARFATEVFETRADAESAEARAIAEEHPRWNLVGRSADHPDGFVSTTQRADWLRPEREVANKVRKLRSEVAVTRKKLRRLLTDLRMEEAVATAISNGDFDLDDDIAPADSALLGESR